MSLKRFNRGFHTPTETATLLILLFWRDWCSCRKVQWNPIQRTSEAMAWLDNFISFMGDKMPDRATVHVMSRPGSTRTWSHSTTIPIRTYSASRRVPMVAATCSINNGIIQNGSQDQVLGSKSSRYVHMHKRFISCCSLHW